jgi:hypothetical protein
MRGAKMIKTIDELLVFLDERIKTLTEIKQEMNDNDDYSNDEYTNGAIDSYDIIRIELTSGSN